MTLPNQPSRTGDRRLPAAAACVALCLGAFLARQVVCAQSQVYCTVNKVTVESLTNSVRITITTDGVPEFDTSWNEYYTRQGGSWVPNRLPVIHFSLPNARSAVGSFADVASYPVSHVQFAVPRDSREGVGLEVSVVLYRAAVVRHVQAGWWHFGSQQTTPTPPSFEIAQSRDRSSIMIIVRSDRYCEPGVAREVAAPERSSLSVTSEADGLISVHALNTPLGEVLRAISETDGIATVVRGGANYRASMTINRAAPALLMRAIARGYGLSVRMTDGVYYVTEGLPTEVDSYWASSTATFPLRNVSPSQALDLLPDFLLRYVHVNAEQNAVVAAGPPQLLDKLESDLRAIDQPPRQIELSAVLVEEREAGGLDLATELVLASGGHTLRAAGATGSLGYELVEDGLRDLQVKLQALRDRDVVATRVCPSITVASGSHAELFLGKRHYFAFLATRGGVQEVTLTSTDVGSALSADPWTGDGRSITIPLRVQANTVVSVDSAGLPLVATREARGTVRMISGDTLIFSGLRMATAEGRRGKIPVPIIGDLTQTQARRVDTSAALVLLSARAYSGVKDARGGPEHQ